MATRGSLVATADVSRIEAPVTVKAYLMCVFASFGGIFFGFDSGYISGVLGMNYFIHLYTDIPIPGPNASATELANFTLPAWKKSLITSILSAGTFFGALIAGDLADWFGRRTTIILGCIIFIVGVILQTASTALGLLVAGRLIAGFGVGFVSAIIFIRCLCQRTGAEHQNRRENNLRVGDHCLGSCSSPQSTKPHLVRMSARGKSA